jgi:hypothetical protein
MVIILDGLSKNSPAITWQNFPLEHIYSNP